ncbi:putative Translation factor GUF1, mitochondrial [Trypanosoma cruzi]|uniref:Translation factor GUF1 homolog 2, mitochondrial n=2 Tax=Trypanosoma cruzi TaxID=5693 RepID=GUF12_TRYCC|nr:GTP-binding protein, putative [Trypanosoma cruzi]Q4DZ91.1 RecName: Full=Translation factor GUF1 homolog 2, mitochondrial; AltName: Full=Elongation factor 4 homolog 2; Short=EF-4 2; AltName: Full=GTPase GUF1 homolog 2; AltName: Full=Ribosomal back-translocase 2; Flags: Precursor [Trypanosoma cruzi strain CL Brener]EAN97856.1 GTP-binding protein, putative [Trypanosoma cruzi]PWV18298.1 putative Translation factor GUF1, mitochondrial [Trypanosoma cruzi]RNC43120.1 putative mitochondrial GTP-bindi|eukprot:XP_819707.1 GTP-binding protein [Trypanosoma cruzi strain CL Brener]
MRVGCCLLLKPLRQRLCTASISSRHIMRWCATSSSNINSTETAAKMPDDDVSGSLSAPSLLKYKIEPSTATMGAPRPPHDDDRAFCTLASFPPSHIRNVAVVAHVDHGKTTLSDAILRRTGVLSGSQVGTYTDRLLVERERGITIKAQTCSIFVVWDGEEFLLNLIDTPGHVDFQYEVSRSLSASDAALLLVDAAQGIEAQTMAHFHMALDRGLTILPVLTKMDAVLSDAPVDRALQDLEDSTGLLRREVLFTSAKEQLGIEALLHAIIERVPPPTGLLGLSDLQQLPPLLPGSAERVAMEEKMVPLRALLFDSWTSECGGGLRRPAPRGGEKVNSGNDNDRNLICLVRIIDGTLTAKTVVTFYQSQRRCEALEVGIIHPELRPTAALTAGMVGYVVFSQVRGEEFLVGETLYTLPTRKFARENIVPVPGFRRVQPVVFAGFYPDEGEYITQLREAVEKLRVNEPAVTMEPLDCPALGSGLQLGFLGMLHMQVFQERLLAEFGQRVLVTPPLVQYKYREAGSDEEEPLKPLTVHTWKWIHEGAACYLEPYVTATIITRREHFQAIDGEALRRFRGEQLDMRVLDDARVLVRYKMPLADLARGFFAVVKSLSHGYASLDYGDPVYEEADLVKVDVLVQKSRISALSVICLRSEAPSIGKRIVSSLKSNLTRTAVDIPLQAMVGSKIVARETVKAYRKDVTAKIHAGDISRKQKKWNDQKKGKERMARRTVGAVTLDQSILAAAMGAISL